MTLLHNKTKVCDAAPTPSPIQTLVTLMAQLRHPDEGCPWDLKQDFRSILPHTLEEAYEVADAIEQNNKQQLKNELGDLLFQVIFYCQLAQEEGSFNFDSVCQAIVDKLIRRHPHVFGDDKVTDSQGALASWEAQKHLERQAQHHTSVMDDVPLALPGLLRAEKLQKRASNVGFDWPNLDQAMNKLDENVSDVKQAQTNANQQAILDEIGDLMFTCVTLTRHLKTNPETVMRTANSKFEKRFRMLENILEDQSKTMTDMSLTKLNATWETTKKALASSSNQD